MAAVRYEFLHHIADAKFRAFGSTMEEAFENAALAMFNIMIDTSGYEPEQVRDFELTAQDTRRLLVDWLSELLYLFEVDEYCSVNSRSKASKLPATALL